MRKFQACLILALAVFAVNIAHAEPGLVVIVRHAEKAKEPAADPALTSEGERRAADLVQAVASAKITSIITTQWRRTRDTAAPLAKALGIEPQVISTKGGDAAAHVRELVEAVRKQSGNVLVVGHSDTVSALLAALNGPKLPNLCDASFDRIFVLAYADPKSSFLNLRYGAPSPPPAEGCQ